FLRINFFKNKLKNQQEYSAADMIDASKRLTDISGEKEIQKLHINGLMTVSEIEKQGREKLGLHLEIFRKSGKVWLKTSSSDHWTLDEQNKEARESEHAPIEKPEENDYHEQE
ncbi:MAG TPA: hypothetical protein PLU53_12075, partial [Bacteroidia bacterium]|nr:hypothetical protein [Bacteroidia bacterium]